MADYDLIVIGSGPGGYVAAIRASQLGLKTACVERAELGGICLNWGCIPTKALLRSAEVFETFHRAKEFGVVLEGSVKPDLAAMIARSREVSAKISKGVQFLFKKNKIDHIQGTGVLVPKKGEWQPQAVKVGDRMITAKFVIVATGARAKGLPGITMDHEHIIEYRKAMTLPFMPKEMIVIGAGAIGVEFASFYRSIGVEVTIVEFLPRLVPNEDPDVSKELDRAFDKRGIKRFVGHKVTSAKRNGDRVDVTIEPKDGGAAVALSADVLLMATGVQANTEDLGLEACGVQLERGFIKVDATLKAADGIYAIGDVIGRGLAHVASAEGVYVAEVLAGHPAIPVNYAAVPACTYCHPEIASVGLTEEKAKAQDVPIKVGKFPFRPLGKALAAGETTGFIKVIWHAETGALVGAHMIGPAVTDLVGEMTLAKNTEVNAESLVYTIHAHPTFAEALKEASEDALGHAIHL
ncbi:MAG TPA: dihydrolipoyl dehydrogenase [Kofleriaceae bacterium]|nr:dihydrolipoyl dehydrogenase [Kofleriaceae bacterium]